ncbi:hypothetical protein DACRYDRAFT_57103 [Dacryopinax primogenitus]|uniref:Uncharacterized protein n=1 Tax=Dacryopinax primogenitus (strain DJM 731) TaxID=1858805 RepID=M5FTK6_DACPD|nr:uncharacterized protein DACRYDRAFT_57103 [Dacryopinax primogenitus]EJT98724.1 hypothetical protein DACRYDRAFT_57103 [Dacryopinax primogenitus]
MGRSAKLHKRVKKSKSSTHSHAVLNSIPATTAVPATAKRRSTTGLKAKAKTSLGSPNAGQLLGGADYVTLAVGGRRRAKKEAEMLASTSGNLEGHSDSIRSSR